MPVIVQFPSRIGSRRQRNFEPKLVTLWTVLHIEFMLETSSDVDTVFHHVCHLRSKSHCATFEITEYGTLATVTTDLLVRLATTAKAHLRHDGLPFDLAQGIARRRSHRGRAASA